MKTDQACRKKVDTGMTKMKIKNSVKNKCSGQKVTRANRKDRKKNLIKKRESKIMREK